MVFSLMLTIDAVTMLRKRHSKSEVALLPTLFLQAPFLKFWQFFLGLNFKRMYWRAGKEKESRCLVFIPLPPRQNFHGIALFIYNQLKENPKFLILFAVLYTKVFPSMSANFNDWIRTTFWVWGKSIAETSCSVLKYKGNVLTSLFQLGIRI